MTNIPSFCITRNTGRCCGIESREAVIYEDLRSPAKVMSSQPDVGRKERGE